MQRVLHSDARTLHMTPIGPLCAIHWPELGGYKIFPARILGEAEARLNGKRTTLADVGILDWTPLAVECDAFDAEAAVALYLARRGC